jgi:hypothetical protein
MMGTSGSSRGSQSGTPLVPTWLDEPQTGTLPRADDAGDLAGGGNSTSDGGDQGTPQETDAAPRPVVEPPPEPERFRRARGNFSRFAASGGNNGGALRRAVRDYVRSGTGGSANAVRRMGASRAAGSNALGVFRGFQRDGVQETLLRLNLQNLAGGSPQDVFLGLTEVICRDGGPVDEAIGRDAWLETVAEIDRFGIDDLETLTGVQIREFFLSFIAHAVEARLYQEIGVNGFRVAEDIDDIEGFDAQFRSYIERAVRDSFSSDLTALSAMSDRDIRTVVDRTYREAWELLELLGDREG